ncbi:hypothetical protein AB2867_25840, partial [Escherichia coli]
KSGVLYGWGRWISMGTGSAFFLGPEKNETGSGSKVVEGVRGEVLGDTPGFVAGNVGEGWDGRLTDTVSSVSMFLFISGN